MSDERKTGSPAEESTSTGSRESVEEKHVDAELEYKDLSNKELLEKVADLDPATYPIVKRAEAALTQLEDSEA